MATEKTHNVDIVADDRDVDRTEPTVAMEQRARPSAARELIETLVIAALLFFGMRLIMPSVVVDGVSMVPSLSNNQHLLENRLAYRHVDVNRLLNIIPGVHKEGTHDLYFFHPPKRGDIVVINPPVTHDKPFIKRIIGLPGDTILIRDGKVQVNGVPFTENYISQAPTYTFPTDGKPYTLKPDEYFVLGDNRNASEDSHYFGPIHSSALMGKTFVSFWPVDEAGFLKRPPYPIPG